MHNSAKNICLYSTSSPSPLSIKKLTSITKSAELSEQLLCRASHDSFVSSVSVSLSAEKWVAADAVNNAETRMDFSKKIMGSHQSHQARFSKISIPEIPGKNSHAY